MVSKVETQVVMSCDGLTVGNVIVPRFELRRGHLVSVRLPVGDDRLCEDLAEILTGSSPTDNLHVSYKLVNVNLPTAGRQTWWPWSRDSPNAYLQRTFNLQAELAQSIVKRHNLTKFRDFRLLPLGPRILLALDGAFHASEACVFNSDGLDPENLAHAYDYISNRLRIGGSAIELSTPYYVDADEPRIRRWRAHPQAMCIDAVPITK